MRLSLSLISRKGIQRNCVDAVENGLFNIGILEFHIPVAVDTWVRGSACLIDMYEFPDDLLLEIHGKVQYLMEDFFGHLKSELLYLQEFESLDHFKQELLDYIDYYNNRRIKASRKGLPPALHRQQALSAA